VPRPPGLPVPRDRLTGCTGRKLVRLPPSDWAHLDERKERDAEPRLHLDDRGLFGPH
jgi:hypothetical protein